MRTWLEFWPYSEARLRTISGSPRLSPFIMPAFVSYYLPLRDFQVLRRPPRFAGQVNRLFLKMSGGLEVQWTGKYEQYKPR